MCQWPSLSTGFHNSCFLGDIVRAHVKLERMMSCIWQTEVSAGTQPWCVQGDLAIHDARQHAHSGALQCSGGEEMFL
jgi:hypothetical protein